MSTKSTITSIFENMLDQLEAKQLASITQNQINGINKQIEYLEAQVKFEKMKQDPEYKDILNILSQPTKFSNDIFNK